MQPAPSPAPSASVLPSASATPTATVSVSAIPATPAAPDEGQMPYARFSDGATPLPGLFTVWVKHGRVFLELEPQQLDHTYMIAPILASGLGEGLFSGIDFDPILVQFHRNGDAIIIQAQNPYGKARAGSPQERAV